MIIILHDVGPIVNALLIMVEYNPALTVFREEKSPAKDESRIGPDRPPP
jgi:hypothetical protein